MSEESSIIDKVVDTAIPLDLSCFFGKGSGQMAIKMIFTVLIAIVIVLKALDNAQK